MEHDKPEIDDDALMMWDFDMLVTVEMPWEAVCDCSASGPVDSAVDYWKDADSVKIDGSEADLIKVLSEYGAWDDDELSIHADNIDRIVWIAAGNINEEPDCFGVSS